MSLRPATALGRSFSTALALFLAWPVMPHAETLVAWDVSTRLTLAYKVPDTAVQKWLPAGWTPNPIAAGPSKGANLLVGFVDRMLNLDPEGKPINGGMDRYLGLVVPALQPGADKPVNVVIRLYQGNPAAVPGAYKNAVAASVTRKQARHGSDVSPSDGVEEWNVGNAAGGSISVRVQYRGGPLTRIKLEPRYYSSVEPDFYRIYRFDQTADVVQSMPGGIDRVEDLSVRIDIPELRAMFDGSEQLMSITVTPWYARQVFLP